MNGCVTKEKCLHLLENFQSYEFPFFVQQTLWNLPPYISLESDFGLLQANYPFTEWKTYTTCINTCCSIKKKISLKFSLKLLWRYTIPKLYVVIAFSWQWSSRRPTARADQRVDQFGLQLAMVVPEHSPHPHLCRRRGWIGLQRKGITIYLV